MAFEYKSLLYFAGELYFTHKKVLPFEICWVPAMFCFFYISSFSNGLFRYELEVITYRFIIKIIKIEIYLFFFIQIIGNNY